MENNCYDLDTCKLLSLEGQKWSLIDFGIDEDSSSNDIEDGKSDSSSTIIPTTNGITYSAYGVSDTMKLKEEDMYLFGICPAYDPFFLAVCEYCGQVIKPQALAKHIELRHRFSIDSNNGKTINSTNDLLEDGYNAQSSVLLTGSKSISNRVGSNGDANRLGDSINSLAGRSSLFSSDNKNDSIRNILLETIPPGPGPGSSSSSPLSFGQPNNNINPISNNIVAHLKSSVSLPNQSGTNSPFNNIAALGSNSSAASSPNSSNSSQTQGSGNLLNNTRYSSQQSSSNKTDTGAMGPAIGNTIGNNKSKSTNNTLTKKASIRGKLLPCKDREYDPDKHCGVKIGDMDKPCTRSLTCKTHSLTLRRSVLDRSKNFDDLLAEHRASKEALLRAAGIEVKPTKQQLKQRELEAKRQLIQQQQQQQQQQQKQQKQQQQQLKQQKNQPILTQQKVDQQNSHINQHHLRNHPQELFMPAPSTLQSKEFKPIGSPSNQNLITEKKKNLTVPNRQLNESVDCKPEPKSSIPSTSTPPTLPATYSNHSEKTNFIEADGCLYLPNPPKPMALCNFNARQISIEPLNCDQDDSPCNLSSRLFNRKRDLTYSALTIFRTQSKTDGRTNNQKLLSLLNAN